MNFNNLQDILRLELNRRVSRKQLTGTYLAKRAGFRQAHISNYLNQKRTMSLEGLDRVLEAQCLTVEDIIALQAEAEEKDIPAYCGSSLSTVCPESATNRHPLFESSAIGDMDTFGASIVEVPIVSPSTVIEDLQISPSCVIEAMPFSGKWLQSGGAPDTHKRSAWQRFVGLRPDNQQVAAMKPLLAEGCIVVIDRHCNSLARHEQSGRSDTPNVFAVRSGPGLLLRFVEFDGTRLILRPQDMDVPIQLIPLAQDQSVADHIVGRVCALYNDF